MMPLLILLADADAMVARARAITQAERPCVFRPDTTDITICGRRSADRFRVPLTVIDPADRKNEGVPAERVRLLHRTTPVGDLSPFLVGGGMAGVSMRVGSGGTHVGGQRAFAP